MFIAFAVLVLYFCVVLLIKRDVKLRLLLLNFRNCKKYAKINGSVLDYKEFEGRNHFVLGQRTWKGDADYILDWLGKL